jgi:Na+/H+ antiporter NhaC
VVNKVPSVDITYITPVIIALGLTLWTRNIVIGLFSGAVTAVIMLVVFNPLDAMTPFFNLILDCFSNTARSFKVR